MNTNQNYLTSVKISTNKNMYGTGIIVSLSKTNEYIILTCAHCLDGINDKNDIVIEIYERKRGNNVIHTLKIDSSKIEDYVLYDDKSIDQKYRVDIAAILIKDIDLKCNPTLWADIGEVDNKEIIYFQGCPMTLGNDKYTNTTVLEGKLEEIVDNNLENIYQIKLQKELQNTTNSTQKQTLEGMSGGAIYYKKNNKNIVIGIAQEVQSKDGEDIHYSNFYALKIKYALDRLRDQGVIVYDVHYSDQKLNIKWIKDKDFSEYDNKEILVIGGSGSGKSSFIKSFARQREDIDSSGDGQTTRMSVEYNFSLYESEPRIEIKYIDESKFIQNRYQNIQKKLIIFKYKLLGFPEYDIENEIDIAIKGLMRNLKVLLIDYKEDERFVNKIEKFITDWDEVNYDNSEDRGDKIVDLNNELIIILATFDYEKLSNNGFANWQIVNSKDWKKYLNVLKNMLLVDIGFFSYKEFDFISLEGTKVISEEIADIFEKIFGTYQEDVSNQHENRLIVKYINNFVLEDLDDKIHGFYKNVYKLINEEIRKNKLRNEKYLLKDLNAHKKDILAKCLKVVDGQSLTSFISGISIYDNLADEYAMIFEELQINSLMFIDTCGLDHVERGEASREVLNKVLAAYKDNIKTIFYVKKLDSGRPTELEKIIPNIYATQANASLYCIFNGIDIFYDSSKYDNRIIDWKVDERELPRAVKYITSDEGQSDIELAMKKEKIRSGRRKIIFSTLTKNLIPFCGNLDKNNNSKFIFNNKEYIKKLFTSIALEESLGLEVIDDKHILQVLNKENFKHSLLNLLRIMFEKASITNWFRSNYGHGHYKVKEKNIENINQQNLGYAGSYNDLWNHKFKQSYNDLFSYENSDFNIEDLFQISEECSYVDKLEALIIDLKVDFLGCPKYKNDIFSTYRSECENCGERCFRNILITMYSKCDEEGRNIFKYNLEYKPQGISEEHLYLNEVCNFGKGFEYIKNEILEYYIFLLKKKIENENSKNINRILKVNKNIKKNYNDLVEDIYQGFLGCTSDRDKLFDLVINHIKVG